MPIPLEMRQLAWTPAAGLLALLTAGAATTRPATTPPGTLVGISVPSRIAQVSPEQAGKLVEVAVHDGEHVRAGARLFGLNATLEKLEVARLRDMVATDVKERRATKMLEHARREADRVRDLHDREISSERDLQRVQHELEMAQLACELAELERRQLSNQLMQAEEMLAQRTVNAPFDGVVTARYQSVGEAVERFVPVVELMDLDPLWIEFECPYTQQHLFETGGSAWIAPAMRPDDVRRAEVLFVSPKGTASSHSFMVRASVPNADLTWKSGMKMTIEPAGEGPPSKPGK